jgi:hypothetical protein
MNPQWLDDVSAPDKLVRAVYECISGAAGAPRDWDRFRFLHHPRALSLRTVVNDDGSTFAAVFSVDEYIANVAPFFAVTDFLELEVDRRVEIFGSVAHIWSVYEARPAPDSPILLKRGANSIQLCFEQGRWWAFCTVWDNEREGLRFDIF